MKYLLSAVTVLFLCSCTQLDEIRPDRTFVEAEQSVHDTVAPVLRNFADGDDTNNPDLSGVNGTALVQLLDLWKERLARAAQNATDGAP